MKRLLESLQPFAQGCQVYVAIVDNSQDPQGKETEALRKAASLASSSSLTVEVITAERNLGYAAGNNVGINRLIEMGATLLWVLNPDTVIRGSASRLVAEAACSAGTLWSTKTVENGITSHGLGRLNTLTGQAGSSPSLTVGVERFSIRYPGGHSLVFTVETWRTLMGFDEDYFLFMEEADLTLRSQHLGVVVRTLLSVTVHHDQGLTTGATKDVLSKSLVAFSEATRSRMIFFRKFYPWRLPILVVSRTAYMISVLVRGNLSGARAINQGIKSGLSMKRLSKGQGRGR
ncbi:glycosyltransferase family 2 protein [Pseudarthrobacter sulfonivorans]|uniref:glycosyltransferase family 2 protein n=1 Tax=Pseudarthrobacter sulfonivorans TaxID=121292 RepID=UPI00168B62FA|nr:hypothetical protein [Pseudarthrobacter sulfonivorans]